VINCLELYTANRNHLSPKGLMISHRKSRNWLATVKPMVNFLGLKVFSLKFYRVQTALSLNVVYERKLEMKTFLQGWEIFRPV
uniref:Uncharacterized protein n=1 Tax=Nothoprocta perdicaria TaxID=30464 RepID=A0A8C6YTR3_NOTPE